MPIPRRSLVLGLPGAVLGGGALVAASSSAAAASSSAAAESSLRRAPVAAYQRSSRWVSGVASPDPEAFGAWRGSPVAILGMYADVSVAAQREVHQFVHGSLNCDVDLAVGGPIGHTWAEAAAGAEVPLWKETAAALRANWRYRTVYLRYAHEANGTWMRWSVSRSQVPAFKATFRLFASTMRAALGGRDVKIVFGPNFGTWNRYSPSTMWPGSDVVDVVGVSMYEWTRCDTPAKWRAFVNSSIGPVHWSRFARRIGRPMALSEWGGRSPNFLRSMNAWMRANAGRGAGQFLYDVYLNTTQFELTGAAATAYRSVNWGR